MREQDFILDEGKCIGLPACLTQPLRDFGFGGVPEVHTIQYVVLDTAREEDGLLLHQRYLRLVIPLVVELLDVLSREEEPAIDRVVEALNQRDD